MNKRKTTQAKVKRRKLKKPKRVMVISDLHVGSSTAVCSEKPIISDLSTYYVPNKLQKTFFRAWKDMIKSIHGTIDLLVINGECIDGANVKQLGQQSWTTNIDDMMNDAKKLIEMIPYTKVLILRGSGYLEQVDGTNFEELMADKLRDCIKYKAYGGEGKTDYFAFIKIYGKTFNFTHHIGFSKAEAYRTTALAREMVGMHFQHDKLGRADIMVRSHVHYFTHVEFTHTHGCTTPAWKYPDSHLFRGGLAGTTADIGSVMFTIHPNGKVEFEKYIAEIDYKPKVLNL